MDGHDKVVGKEGELEMLCDGQVRRRGCECVGACAAEDGTTGCYCRGCMEGCQDMHRNCDATPCSFCVEQTEAWRHDYRTPLWLGHSGISCMCDGCSRPRLEAMN